MRLSAVAFFMILTTFFLSGCDNARLAVLEDRGGNYYGRNGVLSLAGVLPVFAQPIAAQNAAAPFARAAATSTWQWPVQGRVIETYGQKSEGIANEGIVIGAEYGAPIHAVQAGEVAFVGNDTKIYGNIVIIRHADGQMTSYSHASDILVKKGDKPAAGGIIGHVGQSGAAREPQLHFAVREGNRSIDPLSRLPHQLASN